MNKEKLISAFYFLKGYTKGSWYDSSSGKVLRSQWEAAFCVRLSRLQQEILQALTSADARPETHRSEWQERLSAFFLFYFYWLLLTLGLINDDDDDDSTEDIFQERSRTSVTSQNVDADSRVQTS